MCDGALRTQRSTADRRCRTSQRVVAAGQIWAAGTNQPASVGRAVSHGCVRLRNEDIAKLYAMVPVGTPVYIY